MTSKPTIGSQVKVLVSNRGLAPVFSPFLGKMTSGTSPTSEYTGEVVRSSLWLTPDEFALSTDVPGFPVRIINLKDVLSIDGVFVEKTADSITTTAVPGSNGMVYQVQSRNGKPFACTCPGFTFRKQCRHVDGEPKEKAVVRPTVARAEGPSKADKARELFKMLKGDRKACITAFMEKLSMSQASAQTYFYSIKGAKK